MPRSPGLWRADERPLYGLPPTGIRAEIDKLIAGSERGSLLEHFEEVARAAVRLAFQTALETEVTEFLCRESRRRDG